MASMHNRWNTAAARHMLSMVLGLTVILATAMAGIAAAIIIPQAQAASVGSLTIDAVWERGETDATPLAGDTYSIVRVASADTDGAGNIAAFHMLDSFTQFNQNWTEITSSQYHDAAATIAAYVQQHNLYTESAVTNANGKALFAGLPIGLYLVERTGSAQANSQYDCDPFLVAIPGNDNGIAQLDVIAEPKFGEHEDVTPPSTPTTKPETPANTGSAVSMLAVIAIALATIALMIRAYRHREIDK